jgi:ribulose 1,5-bisphosphate synthetase/thiazole synthase
VGITDRLLAPATQVRSTLARAAANAGAGLLELTFELEDLMVSSNESS